MTDREPSAGAVKAACEYLDGMASHIDLACTLDAFARQAAERVRERAARECEAVSVPRLGKVGMDDAFVRLRAECAAAIRALPVEEAGRG